MALGSAVYFACNHVVLYLSIVSRLLQRYGLKLHNTTSVSGRRILVFALLAILAWSAPAGAQDNAGWWGSSCWWDWSDYRGTVGLRYFMARFTSGSIERSAYPDEGIGKVSFDLRSDKYGFKEDMEPFVECWGIFYIDRLGLRFHVEDTQKFEGIHSGTGIGPNIDRLSVFDIRGSRLGIDLDIVRYPFLRLGINGDWHTPPVKFLDRSRPGIPAVNDWYLYQSDGPITIGIHGRAIPIRVREVPFTIQARGRMYIPYLKRQTETRVIDVEVSAGLRPAVWDMSLYGHSTFSMGIEAGYRFQDLEMFSQGPNFNFAPPPGQRYPTQLSDMTLKARWQGAFVQVILFY